MRWDTNVRERGRGERKENGKRGEEQRRISEKGERYKLRLNEREITGRVDK